MAFAPDGNLAADHENGSVQMRDLAWLAQLYAEPTGPLEEACARAGGSLDRTAWDSYAPNIDYPKICP
jgi:hypothetical protein